MICSPSQLPNYPLTAQLYAPVPCHTQPCSDVPTSARPCPPMPFRTLNAISYPPRINPALLNVILHTSPCCTPPAPHQRQLPGWADLAYSQEYEITAPIPKLLLHSSITTVFSVLTIIFSSAASIIVSLYLYFWYH